MRIGQDMKKIVLQHRGISRRVTLSLSAIAVTVILMAVLFGTAFMQGRVLFSDIETTRIPLVDAAFSLVQQSERIESLTSEIVTARNNYIRRSLMLELQRENIRWNKLLGGVTGEGALSWKQRISEDMANAFETKTALAGDMTELVRLRENAAEIRMRLLVLVSRLNSIPVPPEEGSSLVALIRQENIITGTLLALETATATAADTLERELRLVFEKAGPLLKDLPKEQHSRVSRIYEEIGTFAFGELSLFANARARGALQKRVDNGLVKNTFLAGRISRSVNALLAASQKRMGEDVTRLAGNLDGYQRLLFSFFPLCLILVLAVMWYMRRSVVGRILRLNRAALRLARLESFSDVRRVEVEGDDEIGRLAGSINTLLLEISRREEAVLSSHTMLEEKVDRRTAQLHEQNVALKKEILERRTVQEALEESQKRLRFLSARLLETQEEERRRIAAELHDDIGPFLVSIKFGLEGVSGRESCPPDQKKMLLTVIDMVRNVADQLDSIRLTLRPSMLDDLGVIESLDWYCGEFSEIHQHINVQTDVYASEANVPPHLKIVIFRVIQEALTNVAKYSEASEVRISLVSEATTLRLAVIDNGRGFDPVQIRKGYEKKIGRGFGLVSMRERVENTEGRFDIVSGTGKGTSISAVWGEDGG